MRMSNSVRTVMGAFLRAACLLAITARVQAQESTNIAPRADEVLRAASQYLAEAPQFTARAEIWRERVTESGQKLQFTRTFELHVKRPNRLRAEIRSPLTERAFYYDGKSLVILDRKDNVFSRTAMPENLDAALDAAHDQFGVDLPLMDLAVSDPYKNATARVERGRYFGVAMVLGVPCHHLAFTQENIDWQLWVEEGPRPLIRKFVITHKNEEGAPEFTAVITQWNLSDRISESDFVFTPPPGASKIEMRPDSNASASPPPSTASQPSP
jgi:hypothetical protein